MALPVMSAEDTVRYKIFPQLPEDLKGADAVRAELSKRLKSIEDKLRSKIDAYMWHVQKFNLRVVDGTDAHLGGSVFYGENVDDEWFVAHLFLELTRDEHDLVVQIDDEDGDIFLIEAANSLPKWLTPETGVDRVYLHRGVVHIVPATLLSQDELSVRRAVETVRSSPAKTVATSSIQQAICAKVKDFESADSMRTAKLHQATVLLPVKAAQLLKERPVLVADAVRSFHFRTPMDERALRAMKFFPPESCVRRNILVSRFNYALLRHERYAPNPLTGWKIPAKRKDKDSAEFIEADLGMKIASGLEILCVNLEKDKSCLGTNARFLHYLRRLKERNYFQGFLDGSGKYEELYEQAKSFFLQQDNDGEDPDISHQPLDILGMVRDADPDLELLRKEELSLEMADSEHWLELSDKELDSLLKQYTQGAPSAALQEAFNEKSLAKQITDGLTDFVDKKSPFDGVVANHSACKTKRKNKKERKKGQAQKDKSAKGPRETEVDLNNFIEALQSFRIPSNTEELPISSDEDVDNIDLGSASFDGMPDWQQYLDTMDKELSYTSMAKSFEHVEAPRASAEDWDDDVPEVDIPLTALKNLLKSSAAAGCRAGPAQNLLHSMGVHVPPTNDSDDDPDPQV